MYYTMSEESRHRHSGPTVIFLDWTWIDGDGSMNDSVGDGSFYLFFISVLFLV